MNFFQRCFLPLRFSLTYNQSNFKRQFSVSTTKNAFMTINGSNIYYNILGNGPQTIFCLPGIIGFTESDFGPVMRALDPSKYTVVCWDPPGYGQSRPPDRDFCTEFYIRDSQVADKLMQNLNIKSYAALGWSNGGITAVHLAANNPDAVEKIVMWGAHGYMDEKALQFAQMMGNLDLWSEKMLKPMLDMYGKEYLQKLLTDWAKAVEDYSINNCTEEYYKDQRKVVCPTLILHGTLDQIIDVAHAESLHKNIPNSSLQIIPGGKHNIHLKDTAFFISLVSKFLSASSLQRNSFTTVLPAPPKHE